MLGPGFATLPGDHVQTGDILSRLGAALYPTVAWCFHPCRVRRTTRDREILDVARNPRSAGA